MRALAWTIVAIAMTSAAVPARAQTYDPNYPVCIQVYTRGANYISCGFTSIAQCQMSASGRAAQCLVPQLLRHFDPDVVCLSPRVEFVIFLGRHRQVSSLDRDIAMQARQHLRISQPVAPVFLQFIEEEFLRVVMFGEGARGAGDFHVVWIPVPGTQSAPLQPDIWNAQLDESVRPAVAPPMACC